MWENNWLSIDGGDKTGNRLTLVGAEAIKHFVEDDSHGPDISFGGVGFALEDFWGHVDRGS